MILPKSDFTIIVLLISVVVFPMQANCTNNSYVNTTCGIEIPITNAGDEHLVVSLIFSQPQSNGAVCSWLIPAGNDSMSNQIILTGIGDPDTLTCGMNVFSVMEKTLQNGALNPLTLECIDMNNISQYSPVVGYPGFPVVVSMNTTSALSENFIFMHIVPFIWTAEACPRIERKVVIAHPGNKASNEVLRPALNSRFPDNLLCMWEFRSPDEGIVHLEIMTTHYNWECCNSCKGGDYFLVTDGNQTAHPIIVHFCKEPGVRFQYTSTTGSIFVNMISDSSEGAYQDFYFKYWSVQSCPSTQVAYLAYVGEKYHLKGSSFSSHGAGQKRQCWWQITANMYSVITLYGLEAEEFQQNCNDSKDYLMVNSQKVSICNSNMFPIWSEDNSMHIVFHSDTMLQRRSFVLHFAAVYKSPCQGHPEKKTVDGSRNIGDHAVLLPISLGDIQNGLLCQWIFTAKDAGNFVQVSVGWAENSSPTSSHGVPFDKETCSFPNFRAYNGITADNSSAAVITPTCSRNKSTIIYTSKSRSLLFTYRRKSGMAESGFVMDVNQVWDTTNDGASFVGGRDRAHFLGWRITGLMSLVLLFDG